jgi:ubiquinone/menaquinone biosynthesis C-methylase UbiE
MLRENKKFKNFFEPYAKNIDEVNQLAFWKLNNEIILKIIKRHIPMATPRKKIILDAGGGTGRWICNLSKIYKTDFIIYDLSQDMLDKARENIKRVKINKRVKIIRGDLTDLKEIFNSSVDFIISIYNPISFIGQKEKAISELYRSLKKDGKILIMGQGFYNAIFSKITNFVATAKELKWMEKNSKVKWGEHIQALHVFSRESLEKLMETKGFKVVKSYGIPIFVQPGPEDFAENSSGESRISQALRENKSFYNEILRLEMKYNSKPELINRGINIFTVAQK